MNDFRKIWIPLADRFYRVAYHLLESRDDAEDAVRLKKYMEEEAIEAEKERIRAEKRAANPEGITANTSKKKLQQKQKAEEEISMERKQMLMDVRSEISDIAVSIASKVVEREVQKKDHDNFVDEFIRKYLSGPQ